MSNINNNKINLTDDLPITRTKINNIIDIISNKTKYDECLENHINDNGNIVKPHGVLLNLENDHYQFDSTIWELSGFEQLNILDNFVISFAPDKEEVPIVDISFGNSIKSSNSSRSHFMSIMFNDVDDTLHKQIFDVTASSVSLLPSSGNILHAYLDQSDDKKVVALTSYLMNNVDDTSGSENSVAIGIYQYNSADETMLDGLQYYYQTGINKVVGYDQIWDANNNKLFILIVGYDIDSSNYVLKKCEIDFSDIYNLTSTGFGLCCNADNINRIHTLMKINIGDGFKQSRRHSFFLSSNRYNAPDKTLFIVSGNSSPLDKNYLCTIDPLTIDVLNLSEGDFNIIDYDAVEPDLSDGLLSKIVPLAFTKTINDGSDYDVNVEIENNEMYVWYDIDKNSIVVKSLSNNNNKSDGSPTLYGYHTSFVKNEYNLDKLDSYVNIYKNRNVKVATDIEHLPNDNAYYKGHTIRASIGTSSSTLSIMLYYTESPFFTLELMLDFLTPFSDYVIAHQFLIDAYEVDVDGRIVSKNGRHFGIPSTQLYEFYVDGDKYSNISIKRYNNALSTLVDKNINTYFILDRITEFCRFTNLDDSSKHNTLSHTDVILSKYDPNFDKWVVVNDIRNFI